MNMQNPNAVTTFNQWLNVEMKVNNAQSRLAIINEGLDSLELLLDFDSATIKILCETVRRPGGMDGDNRPHPGNHVSALSVIRLQQATFAANIYFRCQRSLNFERLTYDTIKRLYNYKRIEDSYEEPTKMDPPTRSFHIIKWIESFEVYLQKYLGVRKIPLSYVIRQTSTVRNDDEDPPNNYFNISLEMINRGDHTHASFQDDNATVWSLIHECLKETQYYISIRSFARNRDGRRAYDALCLHNLGSSKWELIIQKAENSISHTVYTEEKLRFPFSKYVAIHRDAYNDMMRTPNYNVPDESSRVRRLISGIQSKDPAIISAVTNVQTNYALAGNFEAAADAIQKCIKTKKITQNHRISATSTRNAPNNNKKVHKGKTGVELRYYKRKEYAKLSKEQRAELYQWQKDNKSTNKDISKENDAISQKIAALSKQVESTSKLIQALETKVNSNNSSGSDTNNSNNRALSRVTFAANTNE